MLRFVAEKQSDGTWTARFARAINFTGSGDDPVTAVNRFIDNFGWDKIEITGLTEVSDMKATDYKVFSIPLNDLGRHTLHVSNG